MSRTEDIERLSELEESLGKCKIDVFASIANINRTLGEQDLTRAKMDSKLDEIMKLVNTNDAKLAHHTEEEMVKFDEILNTIKKLTETMQTLIEETENNSDYVSTKQHAEEVEKAVRRRIQEMNAPRDEMWHKVKMTAIVIITGAVLTGIGSALKFGFDMYVMIHGVN